MRGSFIWMYEGKVSEKVVLKEGWSLIRAIIHKGFKSKSSLLLLGQTAHKMVTSSVAVTSTPFTDTGKAL